MLAGVEFEGTIFVDNNKDNDWIGSIFSFQVIICLLSKMNCKQGYCRTVPISTCSWALRLEVTRAPGRSRELSPALDLWEPLCLMPAESLCLSLDKLSSSGSAQEDPLGGSMTPPTGSTLEFQMIHWFSQSQRRPLLGLSPGWNHLLALSSL